MALPEKVIEQLGREPSGTQGWAVGALLFSGGIFFLAIVVYVGLAFGYGPYLQSQLTDTQNKVSALDNSISTSDQSQLINFYSQITNLQTLLANHVFTSNFFAWLQQSTEANVYYQTFALSPGGNVALSGIAASEADVNQQVAIFENSPEVSSVNITNVSAPQAGGSGWDFTATIIMNPSVFTASASSQ